MGHSFNGDEQSPETDSNSEDFLEGEKSTWENTALVSDSLVLIFLGC